MPRSDARWIQLRWFRLRHDGSPARAGKWAGNRVHLLRKLPFSTGNFKFVCLVHADMTGVVHVVNASTPLPHDQNFYAQQAQGMQLRLLAGATPSGCWEPLGRKPALSAPESERL